MSEPKPVRRIVTVDDDDGKSVAISDGPSPDVCTDPARPGYASTRMWVTDGTPARIKGIRETLDAPHTIEPPPGGSVCRIVTFPSDESYLGRITARDVHNFFAAMGSPHASTYRPDAPHPYMQKTRTLDFCLVLEGTITLVLDTEEVQLEAGDTVVQRGTNHAWSNRSGKPCVIAFSSHDGSWAAE
jgi:mannose-6-phosphate isomerase-like protein (cupin superfamily)